MASNNFNATGVKSGVEFNASTKGLSIYQSKTGKTYQDSTVLMHFFQSEGSIRSGVLSKKAAVMFDQMLTAAQTAGQNLGEATRQFIASKLQFGNIATGDYDEDGVEITIPTLYPRGEVNAILLVHCD